MEAVDCGAACLAMVLASYRLWAPMNEVREACGVSRDGVSAGAVLRAAARYGMEGRGLQMDAAGIGTAALPAIAFWGEDHFVVVEAFRARSLTLIDPATGRRRISHAEFARLFSGIVLELWPGPAFQAGGRPPAVLRGVLALLRPDRAAIKVCAAYALLSIAPALVIPAALKAFVDDVLLRHFVDWMLPIVATLLLAAIVSAALSWLQQACEMRIAAAVGNRMAARTTRHILHLSFLCATRRHPADIAARVALCNQLGTVLAALPGAFLGLITAALFAGVLAVYSTVLLFVVLALAGLGVVLGATRLRLQFDQQATLLGAQSRLAAVSMGGIAAIETLKASGGEDDYYRRWSGQQTAVADLMQQQAATQLWLGIAPQVVAAITPVTVIAVGAWLILQGELTIGGLLATQALLGRVNGPLQSLPKLARQLQQVRALYLRIADLAVVPVPPAPADLTALACTPHAVMFENVTAGYGPGTPDVLHGISFTVCHNERVAFVGASGSGKSTLLRLLSNALEPRSGRILLGGCDARAIPPEALPTALGVVEQELVVFAGTVLDNLTLWDPAANQAAVTEAAGDAELHAVLAAMPGSYHAEVAEGGGNLSGGQRQLLEIARALVPQPSVLVMDEATSALDALTEQRVMDNIRRRGCTCLMVAHRLSTVRDCDRIYVLEAGRVVEMGDHAALMALHGVYAGLVAAG